MVEKLTHQASPIEILFPQGLALLDPQPLTRLPTTAEALRRWIARFIIEPKYNGIRACVEIVSRSNVRIFTKEGNLAGFPILKKRLAILGSGRSIVLDGEIIAGQGKTDQERQIVINQTFSESEIGNIRFVAFDLLMLDSVPLIDFPIEGRKRALARLIPEESQAELNIGIADFVPDGHLAFMKAKEREGFEGVVLKRKGSKYREPHPRSRQPHPWFKYKFK